MFSGTGLLSRFDRIGVKNTIGVLLWRRITAHVPSSTECTETGCGYNQFTHAGVNPACTACNGTGLVTTWSIGYVNGRVAWIDGAHFDYWKGIATGMIGDVAIQGYLYDRELYEQIRDTDGAYLLVDGRRVKPHTVTVNAVEGLTTVDVRCDLVRAA